MKNLQFFLDRLEKSDKNKKDVYWGTYSLDGIAAELNIPNDIYLSEEDLSELKCYFSEINWICTDTRVGLKFYFLNNEFICASFQQGRKSQEEFEWASQEAANKVRQYFIDKIKSKEVIPKVVLVNWEQDLSSWEATRDENIRLYEKYRYKG